MIGEQGEGDITHKPSVVGPHDRMVRILLNLRNWFLWSICFWTNGIEWNNGEKVRGCSSWPVWLLAISLLCNDYVKVVHTQLLLSSHSIKQLERPAKGQWWMAAGKVIVGLAGGNVSAPPSLWPCYPSAACLDVGLAPAQMLVLSVKLLLHSLYWMLNVAPKYCGVVRNDNSVTNIDHLLLGLMA